MTARYYPEIFDTPGIDGAKAIILTDEGPGADTDTRWALETPYVLELLTRAIALSADMVVLDYGCGIGRLAKAMIDATGCTVIGLDTSPDMLRLAGGYVGSDRFIPMQAAQLDALLGAGLRVHAAISVWVLQHCLDPAAEIARLRHSLAASGTAFVLNMPKRAVPAVTLGDTARFTWVSDQLDVAALLRAAFTVVAEGLPDPARTPNMADAGAFWMALRPGLPTRP